MNQLTDKNSYSYLPAISSALRKTSAKLCRKLLGIFSIVAQVTNFFPQDLFSSLVSVGTGTNENAITGMNLMAQFLFRELRFSKLVHQAIIQRINEEVEEQLASSRAGKLINKITIHDFDLGNSIPLLKKMQVVKSEIEPIRKTVEMVELLVEVEYTGSFHLSLDVDSSIVPTTRLSLAVDGLKGEVELGFSRKPYTHWAFAFVRPPVVDMEVKSTIQGTTFTQITTLVAALASKILQRAHVLPNYRIRYKPFFPPPELRLREYSKVAPPVPVGSMSVTIKECSRLLESTLLDTVHCTVAVGMNAFVSVGSSETPEAYLMTIKVARKRNQPFGIIFKPTGMEDIGAEGGPPIVGAITPGSPAHACGILQYDLITHVDGVPTTTVQEAATAVIGAGSRFMLTIQRKGKLDVVVSDLEKYVNVELPVIQVGVEDKPAVDMPPIAEPVDTLPSYEKPVTMEQPVGTAGVAEIGKTTNVTLGKESNAVPPAAELELATEATPFSRITRDIVLKKTSTLAVTPDININETLQLEIRPGDLFFNFALWTTKKDEPNNEKLIGHLSVPLSEITSECESTVLSHYVTTFQICPPDVEGKEAQDHELSSHSGFDSRLCYGDVLFSFLYNATEEQPVSGATVAAGEESAVSVDELAQKLVEGSTMILEESGTKVKDHTFVLTHFYGASVFCDYCAGRIWLRDAVQCITCGTMCHKKCREKCRQTVCHPLRQRERGNLPKKSDVKDNLTIPFSIDDVESLIEDNPFLPTEEEEGDELNAAVHRIMTTKNGEQVTRLAKETAPELYDHLSVQERKERILSMITQLQKAIEGEENQSAMLANQSQIEGVTPGVRNRLAMQMSRSEERKKALALLLLHYSSALQYVADLENAMKLEAQKTMDATASSDVVA